MMLCIIAVNRQHFEHICHLYRIEKDQVIYIDRPDKLRGLRPESIVIFGEEWWRGKTTQDIDMMEEIVKMHNERRKEKCLKK